MEILCFYAGMACVFLNHAYPWLFWVTILFFRFKLKYLIWFIGALVWGQFHLWWVSEKGMPEKPVIKNAILQGYVASIPVQTRHKTQFYLELVKFNDKKVNTMVLLSCYDHCPTLHAGEFWQLKATIKRPRNLGNPGGFDFVSWLNARHISWAGYAKKNSFKLLEPQKNRYFILSLRERLASHLADLSLNEHSLGVLEALSLGVTSHLSKDEWELFRHTGTTHLMIISGAHIGLVAGIAYIWVKWLWARLGVFCLIIPAQRAAGIAAMSLALLYAALAGFGIPAQRALIVCFFMLLRYFTSQRFGSWQAWRYAFFCVILFEPHSLLMTGFYLSFIAVAILIVINQRFRGRGIRQMMKIQFACLAGLMPLTLYWFAYGAVNGLIANLIAIPWVGFVIVPMALLTVITCGWFSIPRLTTFLDYCIQWLLYFLQQMDALTSQWNLRFTFAEVSSPIALMAAMTVFVLLPLKNMRLAATLLAIAAIFPASPKIKPGEVRIDTLDVGQGLAVVIRTATHTLLYDTGVKFYQGSDMGQLAVIPFLNSQGIKNLDTVIISHSDIDHRGGLASIEEKYNVKELIVDNRGFYQRGKSCHHYQDWIWDGISFRFFAIKDSLAGKNNHSCVLQVRSDGGAMLFTGDIEQGAEAYLVATYGGQLKSEAILVPHHGSKTSSSLPFLKQISPQFAIASYGFDNRYHFPHVTTINHYAKEKITLFNTVQCGMVSVHLTANGVLPVQCFNQMKGSLVP
ncbi:DNA uptake/competence protein ComA [Legionella londiniensis]|uniref:DNA uptake/competence protein ComA n=1 Tax=Legionella londiniensis TaxID=45068 RepID=A0A0W0VMD1_9GAMM|nr:DNA uptake/competence protein ComA [Legionella londiniensis]STX93239.1 DNA uptake/competence protein ComA [Legionella londiniensis]